LVAEVVAVPRGDLPGLQAQEPRPDLRRHEQVADIRPVIEDSEAHAGHLRATPRFHSPARSSCARRRVRTRFRTGNRGAPNGRCGRVAGIPPLPNRAKGPETKRNLTQARLWPFSVGAQRRARVRTWELREVASHT